MAFLQWRRFPFFEREFLDESADTLTELAKSCQVTCSSSGNGFLIFGDSSGIINIVSRQHKISSFSAYQIAVTHCCNIISRHSAVNSVTNSSASSSQFLIITVGTDSENLVPTLKIWRINESFLWQTNTQRTMDLNYSYEDDENLTEQPDANPIAVCIRSIMLSPDTPQLQLLRMHTSVTALDAFYDSIIAVGFNDGNCILIMGDLTREKSFKMRLFQTSENCSSITGLAFSSISKMSNQQNKSLRGLSLSKNNIKQHIILFVSTRNEICSFDVSTRDNESKIILDSFGCEIGCSCLKRDPKSLDTIQYIVGRSDAIYFYNVDGRGPCLAYDGQKLFLYWFRNYLVVITHNDIARQTSNLNESPSSTPVSVLNNPNPNLITIYDIGRKFIAFSSPIPSVNQVISEWGILYILTTDGRICVFTEFDTQTKLELLFKKNQFSLAIDLAKTQAYTQDSLAEMFKKYGDHLYQNGDYDGSINQYCQTLGYLEPSYVIRKFFDLQRIHNLTLYLQELHKRGIATEDHTTLLINCYVKLKDEQKLNEFLRSTDIVFDVDIAIRVLRQAGYYDNAIMLAKKHSCYDSYFSILLEEKSDSKSVLTTFHELLNESKQDVVSQYLSKYGRLLMSDQPDQTTNLLKSLCSLLFRETHKNKTTQESDKNSDIVFDMSEFTAVFKDEQFDNATFSPEKYLHIFLNHSSKLIEFLEFIIEESKTITDSEGKNIEVSFEISNTLLEMYLHSYKNEIKEDGLADNETKIMKFLKNENSSYDFKKAMILCQMNNFMPGVLYLYEKTEMFKQILAHFTSRKDSDNVVETCKKYADKEPSLWIDALWYFSEIYSDQHKTNTLTVLQEIERHKLLPPLIVVEILSKHGKVTLGVVRDFLMRWIKSEQEQIEENERLVESYREECQRTRKQIEDIKEKPLTFQTSKCAACLHPLELPSIHFLCNHSYHHTCFESYIAENDHDCPLCLPENRKILNEINMFDNVKNANDFFQQELIESKNPFDVIARYCSQGLFNPLTVVTDDGVIQSKSKQSK